MEILTQEIPVFENNGLTELEKAWKQYSNTDIRVLMQLVEDNFENKIYAVALFLADKILKEKNPSADAIVRLRFVRAESHYEFKFYRQAYPDYKFYTRQQGSSPELDHKMRVCKRAIHTGNNGTLLFIAVFWVCTVIMYLFLYKVQEGVIANNPVNGDSRLFPMGLDLNYIYYAGVVGLAMLLFGLFYRYVVIARMK